MVEGRKTKISRSVLIAAIAGIVIIEVVALLKGVNGHVLALTIAVVAGLAGWVSPQLKLK